MTAALRDAWLATLSHTLKKHPRLIVQTTAGPSELLAKERRYVFTYDPNASGLEQEVSLGLNEFFCMSVAQRAGLTVPRFWLSEDATRFVISRFDRDEHGNPIGFEDMAVLMGVSAAQKYLGSYESVMRATHTYCQGSEAAKESMFARIVASAFLKDGDAHLKNFGLVYEDPGTDVRPSPTYDIVCTAIYPNLDRGLALKMNKSREYPAHEDLVQFGARFSIRKEVALGWIERIEDAITEQLREAAEDPRFVNDPNGTLAKLQEVFRPRGVP